MFNSTNRNISAIISFNTNKVLRHAINSYSCNKRFMKILLVLLFFGHGSAANQTQEAVNAAAKAFYLYQEWDKYINQYVSHYERLLTPEQKQFGSYSYFIARALIDKKVTFIWRF